MVEHTILSWVLKANEGFKFNYNYHKLRIYIYLTLKDVIHSKLTMMLTINYLRRTYTNF